MSILETNNKPDVPVELGDIHCIWFLKTQAPFLLTISFKTQATFLLLTISLTTKASFPLTLSLKTQASFQLTISVPSSLTPIIKHMLPFH